MKQKRISLEILRIIAMCMVIFNHTGENGFEMFRTSYGTPLWHMVILLDLISKAGVPLFFMISGALLLGKDESIKDIFFKRIIRYVIIIGLFSFIYYIHMYIQHPEYGFSLKYFITYIYSTPFIIPYWFLYRYLCFLLVLPVLRAIVKSLKEKEYLLLIAFTVFLWFAPVWEKLFKLDPIALSTGLGTNFILYPIIGYGIANVFSNEYFSLKSRLIVGIVFVLNWIGAVYLNIAEYKELSEMTGSYIDKFCGIPAITVFYFVIYLFEKKKICLPEKLCGLISFIGSAALCTYLFEDMLRSDIFLKMFDLVSGNIARLLVCIPYTICIILCGGIIAVILRKIPGIRRLKI